MILDTSPAPLVVVVDNHELLAESVAEVLGAEGYRASTCGPGTLRPEDLLDRLLALVGAAPAGAVVLVDLNLRRDLDGVDLVGPLARGGARVGLLTGVPDRLRLARAVRAGALAIITKTSSSQVLIEVVRRLVDGRPALDPRYRQELLDELERDEARRRPMVALLGSLTPKEQVVLRYLCDGLLAVDIARREVVSLATVRSQIHAILMKLGVHSQHEAVHLARTAAWPGPEAGLAPAGSAVPQGETAGLAVWAASIQVSPGVPAVGWPSAKR
ncbi:MAG: response regulator transcription factor [Actinomycetota bacterium]|nr:response regulator transcription factor [Actinomycetota bacterium]